MRAKSNELVNELVSACIAFGRGVEPIWDDDDGVLYWMPLPEQPER